MAARLKEKYNKEIKQALKKELGIENMMAVPRLEKVVINMGLGEATQNTKLLDPLVNDLTQIAGQKPVMTKAKMTTLTNVVSMWPAFSPRYTITKQNSEICPSLMLASSALLINESTACLKPSRGR